MTVKVLMAGGGNRISYLGRDGNFHALVQEDILLHGDGNPFNVEYLSRERISRGTAYSGLLLRVQHRYNGSANALLLDFEEDPTKDGIIYHGRAHPFKIKFANEAAFREKNPDFPDL